MDGVFAGASGYDDVLELLCENTQTITTISERYAAQLDALFNEKLTN